MHVHDSARSTETYNRDVLLPAARSLEEVLLAVRDGRLRPDDPLSARFQAASAAPQLPGPVAPPSPTPGPTGPPATPATDSSSSDSGDSSTTDNDTHELPEAVIPPHHRTQRPLVKTLPLHAQAWQHRTSGCLHIQTDSDGPRFLCGREHTDVYRPTGLACLELGQPHCRQCWSHTSLAI